MSYSWLRTGPADPEFARAENETLRLKLIYDDAPGMSPRDWDNVGTMITWGRDYHSPDDTNSYDQDQQSFELFWFGRWSAVDSEDNVWSDDYTSEESANEDSPDEYHAHLEEEGSGTGGVLLGLDRNYHDGSLSAHKYEQGETYDGVIYVTAEKIAEEMLEIGGPSDPLTHLRSEVETYGQWARGETFGYVCERAHIWTDESGAEMKTWDTEESVWGFYPDASKGYGPQTVEYMRGEIPDPWSSELFDALDFD